MCKHRVATVVLLALLLSSCATGNELKGTWTLMVGRDGTCRTIEHQANTDRLSTSTRWRGKHCKADVSRDSTTTVLDLNSTDFESGDEPADSSDQDRTMPLDLEVPNG